MSEGRLPVPVRRVLVDSVDDAKLSRLWQELAAARARRVVPLRRAVLLGAAAVLVASAMALLLRGPGAAPLHLADGRDLPASLARGREGRLAFDDGSSVVVGPGSALDLLESTARSFAMAIRSGDIDVDVTPGGPRTWRIECGSVTVEVVGTHFRVERGAEYVRVSVSRGAVLVRGENVPDHVVRLGPGQAIVVPTRPHAVGATAEAPIRAPDTSTRPDISNPGAAASGNVGTVSIPGVAVPENGPSLPRGLSATGPSRVSTTEVVEATAAPAASGAASAASVAQFTDPNPSAASSITDGLAAADALRRAGRFADAASVLERAIAEHGGEVSTPLAEFSLGRLYLDSLNDPARAEVHFARALRRGLPSAIAEDVQARLVEAGARAGDRRAAAGAAALYHSLYPNGRHSADVDRWAAGDR